MSNGGRRSTPSSYHSARSSFRPDPVVEEVDSDSEEHRYARAHPSSQQQSQSTPSAQPVVEEPDEEAHYAGHEYHRPNGNSRYREEVRDPFQTNFGFHGLDDPFSDPFFRRRAGAPSGPSGNVPAPRSGSLIDSFFGGSGGGFFGDMFSGMHNMMAEFDRKFEEMASGQFPTDGSQVYYSSSVRTTTGPGGVQEVKRVTRDSREGTERVSMARRIGDRSQVIQTTRDVSGHEETLNTVNNMTEDDVDRFNEEWESMASHSFPRWSARERDDYRSNRLEGRGESNSRRPRRAIRDR